MAVNPSDDDKPLVYLARLSAAEKEGLYAVADAFPALHIRKEFHDTIPDVVVDRLIMATDFLKAAQQLVKNAASDADYRGAVNRGYYSIHHAIRAMMLSHKHYETDGHAEAITELKSLLVDAATRNRCGLTQDIIKDITKA
ncbi:MAG: HEPN domain-containing protein [Planctomycetota bacterium]